MFPSHINEDFRGLPTGWSIAHVAGCGENYAGESRHGPSFRPRIRQPARETRAKAAPHGAAHRQGDDSRRIAVASRLPPAPPRLLAMAGGAPRGPADVWTGPPRRARPRNPWAR